MNKTVTRGALLLFVLLVSSSAFGQQRWFENGPTGGAYKRVLWDDVAVITFYNAPIPIGAHIATFSNGKFEDWGNVPKGSRSVADLFKLVNAKKDRWIKAQPFENGRYMSPKEAVGYVDLSRIVSVAKIAVIDLGQEAYVLTLENSTGRAAVIDADEKARIDKIIIDSVAP